MWQIERERRTARDDDRLLLFLHLLLFPRRRRLVLLAPSFAVLFWRVCAGAYDAHMRSMATGYIAQRLERLTADQQVPDSNPGVHL